MDRRRLQRLSRADHEERPEGIYIGGEGKSRLAAPGVRLVVEGEEIASRICQLCRHYRPAQPVLQVEDGCPAASARIPASEGGAVGPEPVPGEIPLGIARIAVEIAELVDTVDRCARRESSEICLLDGSAQRGQTADRRGSLAEVYDLDIPFEAGGAVDDGVDRDRDAVPFVLQPEDGVDAAVFIEGIEGDEGHLLIAGAAVDVEHEGFGVGAGVLRHAGDVAPQDVHRVSRGVPAGYRQPSVREYLLVNGESRAVAEDGLLPGYVIYVLEKIFSGYDRSHVVSPVSLR